jgi:hypothetical protein
MSMAWPTFKYRPVAAPEQVVYKMTAGDTT